MPKRIFFSYAREDLLSVDTLAERIGSAGFTPFFDRDLLGGQQWWDDLLAKIEACDVFVPVLSSSYLRSVPCRIEVSYAVELGKPLVPVDLGGGSLYGAAFIEPIKSTQWITYDTSDPMTVVLQLIAALNSSPPAPPVAAGTTRPAAPGSDVLSTSVRLVGSPHQLTATEQWAVVGELRAHLRGENRGSAKALLETFLQRRDLMVSVHADASAMVGEVASVPPAESAQQAPDEPARRPHGVLNRPQQFAHLCSVLALVSSILSVIPFAVWFFGLPAVILTIMANARNEPHAKRISWVVGLLLVLGVAIALAAA